MPSAQVVSRRIAPAVNSLWLYASVGTHLPEKQRDSLTKPPSKSCNEFAGQQLDLLVTVCGNAADWLWPDFPGVCAPAADADLRAWVDATGLPRPCLKQYLDRIYNLLIIILFFLLSSTDR